MNASNELSDEAKYATADKLTFDFVNNVLYMAYTETHVVTDIDAHVRQVFERARDQPDTLVFVYSSIDPYTPLAFVDDLRADFPQFRIHMADEGVRHAFVLSHSKPVAEQVATLLPDF